MKTKSMDGITMVPPVTGLESGGLAVLFTQCMRLVPICLLVWLTMNDMRRAGVGPGGFGGLLWVLVWVVAAGRAGSCPSCWSGNGGIYMICVIRHL